ncbi:MAG: DUF92 domain-containing protein [Spirochaetia bacterium]
MIPTEWLLGAVVNFFVAAVAFRKNAVSVSGAVAGFVLGTTIYAAGAAYWAVLMVFFISSTLLGRLSPGRRATIHAIQTKGSRRDAWQVIANIGAATLAALAIAAGYGAVAVHAFSAAMAAATADTWSSEIGVLSRTAPVSIRTLKPAVPGISGAISRLGVAAGGAGALVVGLSAAGAVGVHGTTANVPEQMLMTALMAFGLGTLGTLLDSLLGATVQAHYRTREGDVTERPKDSSGAANTLVQGLPWITNDVVNFLTTVTVACVALLLST